MYRGGGSGGGATSSSGMVRLGMDMGMDEGANLAECDDEHLEAPKRSMRLA